MNRVDIGVTVNNDVIYTITLYYNGKRLNLNDYTVNIYVKASQTADDPDSPTYTGTATEPLAGICEWKIPHIDNATAGTQWYRVDVIDEDNNVGSCLCGTLATFAA